jgi:hypothetical protein
MSTYSPVGGYGIIRDVASRTDGNRDHLQAVPRQQQIDVSIRTSVAGHEILIIVQAKDLVRPADVNVVGEFQAVIRDVPAAKGVLTCSSGFTLPAVEYGRNLNITLCTAYDASIANGR